MKRIPKALFFLAIGCFLFPARMVGAGGVLGDTLFLLRLKKGGSKTGEILYRYHVRRTLPPINNEIQNNYNQEIDTVDNLLMTR